MKKCNLDRRQFLKSAVLSAATIGLSHQAILNRAEAATRKTDFSQKIPHRHLGKTGASVPILQIGTAQTLDQDYDKILHLLFREGVYYLDTALSYGWGTSQKAIANFASQIGGRNKLWITSKSGAWSLNGFVKDIDECLADLETDYLDLYLRHSVNDADDINRDLIQIGEKLKKSGKTRFFGFSSHGGDVVELLNKAVKTGGIDAILFSYNFRRYGHRELSLAMDNCKEAGIGLIAMKTMGSVPADAEAVLNFKSKNFTLGQAKLKSVWADDRIDSVVVEMDSIKVARENIAAAISGEQLTANEIHQLNRLAAMTAQYSCQGCSHLCEKAVNKSARIADSLRYLMYHECYGKTDIAKEFYHLIPTNSRSLSDQETTIAQSICPQGIDIKSRLELAQRKLSS
ncbi:MAG: aldo/keto reductase [Desulfobacterales bacterium]|nr:aldo/keto reductase [Desulfobacterales bacterium]